MTDFGRETLLFECHLAFLTISHLSYDVYICILFVCFARFEFKAASIYMSADVAKAKDIVFYQGNTVVLMWRNDES